MNNEYKKAYLREKLARKEAEKILEKKSLELYTLNQELLVANQGLEEKVKKRTNDLEKAKDKAEELAKIKSEFLSMMSHEMRTPLNSILGYTYLLEEQNMNTECDEYVRKISYSGKVLLSIINNVLEHSRLEGSRFSLQEVTLNLKKELEELCSIFKVDILKKKLSYNVIIDENCDEIIRIDFKKVKQILINVIGNAIKFTNAGEVKVKASYEEEFISVSVCDTGKGISKEDLSKIFEPFVRSLKEDNFRYEGTGLGLSITKRLIEVLDGEIEVKSEENVGTCFSIRVRAPLASHPLKLNDPEGIIKINKKLNIIIVDDHQVNAMLLSKILSKQSLSALVLNHGLDCLNELKENPMYDIIFMDLRMPDIDGIETTKRIRTEIPSFKGEIILLTAESYGPEDNYLKYFDGHLGKPYSIKDVLKFLK